MILKSIQGVVKSRQNTTPTAEFISQDGYITAISKDSRVSTNTVTEAKNIRTVKHTLINDPIQPEITLVTAPRKIQ
jgi:hypothetical protein